MKTGISKLDELLDGGVPKGKSLAYYIHPGAEGEVFGLQTAYNTLKCGRICVFVLSTSIPKIIESRFKDFGWDIDLYKNSLFIVDAYTPLIGKSSQEKYVVSNPDRIEDYTKTIIELLKEFPPSTIVFGSLSTIIDLCGERETIESVRIWNKTATLYDHILIYNFTAWPYSLETLNSIKEDLFNAVVLIGTIDENTMFGRYFSIYKADWTKNHLIPFKLSRHGGIVTKSLSDEKSLKFSRNSTSITHYHEPKIKYKHVADTSKDWVRFCLVQLDFSLDLKQPSEEFGYVLHEEGKIKGKIFKALKIAEKNGVDIICFPELSFFKGWIEEIKNRYKEMIIIGGSYYDKGYNVCPIIINGMCIDPAYKKYHPSPFETPEPTGRGMRSGDLIYIFQTKYGRFSVLTCIDYADLSYPICRYRDKEIKGVDFIINPCYDQNIRRFQHRCNSDCEDFGINVIQVNRASEGEKYGGTCIIGKEHEIILNRLKDEKFKPNDDIKYKLYHVNSEMLLIADLNIQIKAPPVDLPIDYAGRIRIFKRYKYNKENDNWQQLSN
ncbi:KaiC [uncultured archaeon]|nr:KaiC [uncultured archaeon]